MIDRYDPQWVAHLEAVALRRREEITTAVAQVTQDLGVEAATIAAASMVKVWMASVEQEAGDTFEESTDVSDQ